MTVKRYLKSNLAAAMLAAAMTVAPAGVLACETAPQVPGAQAAQQTMERIPSLKNAETCRGVTVSRKWLRQARLNGMFINLRLYTPMGDGLLFREQLKVSKNDVDVMCLYLQASTNDDVITLQVDQSAMDTLKRLGVAEVVVADADRYVRAHYRTDELQAVRDALSLGEGEQLCVSGEDAPVTVVSEDGVRRQVN